MDYTSSRPWTGSHWLQCRCIASRPPSYSPQAALTSVGWRNHRHSPCSSCLVRSLGRRPAAGTGLQWARAELAAGADYPPSRPRRACGCCALGRGVNECVRYHGLALHLQRRRDDGAAIEVHRRASRSPTRAAGVPSGHVLDRRAGARLNFRNGIFRRGAWCGPFNRNLSGRAAGPASH